MWSALNHVLHESRPSRPELLAFPELSGGILDLMQSLQEPDSCPTLSVAYQTLKVIQGSETEICRNESKARLECRK